MCFDLNHLMGNNVLYDLVVKPNIFPNPSNLTPSDFAEVAIWKATPLPWRGAKVIGTQMIFNHLFTEFYIQQYKPNVAPLCGRGVALQIENLTMLDGVRWFGRGFK